MAHEDILAKRQIVYIHVNAEDGGPQCGLLSLSTIIQDSGFNTLGDFNQFVRPPDGAVWEEQASTESHGYKPTDNLIVNAQPIDRNAHGVGRQAGFRRSFACLADGTWIKKLPGLGMAYARS